MTSPNRQPTPTIRSLRADLDDAAMEAAAADQDGAGVEFANEKVLSAAHSLGLALLARKERKEPTR